MAISDPSGQNFLVSSEHARFIRTGPDPAATPFAARLLWGLGVQYGMGSLRPDAPGVRALYILAAVVAFELVLRACRT